MLILFCAFFFSLHIQQLQQRCIYLFIINDIANNEHLKEKILRKIINFFPLQTL